MADRVLKWKVCKGITNEARAIGNLLQAKDLSSSLDALGIVKEEANLVLSASLLPQRCTRFQFRQERGV